MKKVIFAVAIASVAGIGYKFWKEQTETQTIWGEVTDTIPTK